MVCVPSLLISLVVVIKLAVGTLNHHRRLKIPAKSATW